MWLRKRLLMTTSVAALMAGAGAPDAYAENGFSPAFVADFAGIENSGVEYYRVSDSDSDFDTAFTFSRSGLATMTDSDGNLKWAPHNLIPRSTQFDHADWARTGTPTITTGQSDPDGGTDAVRLAASSGVDTKIRSADMSLSNGGQYTFEVVAKYVSGSGWMLCFGSAGVGSVGAWFDVQNGTIGTEQANVLDARITSLGSGWYLIAIDYAATADTTLHDRTIELASANNSSVAGASDALDIYASRVYRSDLGGMVDNPDRSDSYVATTTTAVHQARRNHHRFNGATYDIKGLLLETEARTNLIVQSNAFTTTWTDTNATPASAAATGPDGATSMWNLVDDNTSGTGEVYLDYALTGLSTSTLYTFSAFVKANALSWCALGTENFTTPANGESFFNLSTGAKGTAASGHTQNIEEVASGIYRVSITFTTDASDTTGNVRIYAADADTDITVDLDGTSSVYVYGAQMEAGSTPTSYVPSSGSTVARPAESCVAQATYDASGVSLHASGEINYYDNNSSNELALYWWDRAVGNNYIRSILATNGSYAGRHNTIQYDGTNVDQVGESSPGSLSPSVNVAFNAASRHTASAINIAINGTALTENSTPTSMPVLDGDLHLLQDVDNGTTGEGVVALFRVWGDDIGDTGIESATS